MCFKSGYNMLQLWRQQWWQWHWNNETTASLQQNSESNLCPELGMLIASDDVRLRLQVRPLQNCPTSHRKKYKYWMMLKTSHRNHRKKYNYWMMLKTSHRNHRKKYNYWMMLSHSLSQNPNGPDDDSNFDPIFDDTPDTQVGDGNEVDDLPTVELPSSSSAAPADVRHFPISPKRRRLRHVMCD